MCWSPYKALGEKKSPHMYAEAIQRQSDVFMFTAVHEVGVNLNGAGK